MLLAVLYVAAFAVSISEAQLVPGIFGPATGVCGPITVPYGGSGSGSQLQTFVAPSPGQPTAYTTCNPSINDTYVYTLGPSGLPSYSLTPALRVIGTDISPALGYFDTPKLDLTKVTPLAGAPTPIPAGTYDVGLRYNSTASSEKCLNGSHTSSSVFIIQAPTTTSLTGPATSGSSTFTLTVNVTYSAAAVQLPFSNSAAIASGSVQITTSGSSPQSLNGSATVSANGTGFVTYRMTPAQPLAVGSYSVVATYTPTANFVYGSTSSPYVFTVTPAVTTPPPTSTAAPTTSAPPTTTAKATTTAAPKTTTSAPKTTTAAPKTTTAAPKSTTAAPKSTTAAPKPTTKAPPTTTPKPTTTKPPPTTRSPIVSFCCAMGLGFCCR